MDSDPNRSPRDDDNAENDETSIIPLEVEHREAPPRDIDARDDADHEPEEPIELSEPDTGAESTDQIDELQPLPVDHPYHEDDTAAPDPYNVDDTVDLTFPRPSWDAPRDGSGATTQEDFGVDTDPETRTDATTTTGDATGTVEDDPAYQDDSNDDSVYVELPPEPSSERAADSPSESIIVAPGTPSGETTCPVCGRQTDALHFCGYCGAKLTEDRHQITSSSMIGRLVERAENVLAPLGAWTRPGAVRFILAVGALLILIALLANKGALAMIVGSAILPLVLVFWCLHRDVFENEPAPLLGMFGVAGTLVGVILGGLASWIVARTWFDTGVLNYGAAQLGGAFASDAGTPPFLVWFVVGIIFPLLALATIIGAPLAMRQTVTLKNEIMDGLTLGVIIGGGISFGSAIVFAAPMITHGGPATDTSAWTLTLIGLTVIRPLVWTLCGGMLGAATWRYMLSGQISHAFIPAVVGAAGVLLFTFVSIQVTATSLWLEILWGVIVAIVVGFFYARTINQAVTYDRSILGNNDERVICPHCRQVTPTGTYCAHCGQPLAATPAQDHRAGDEPA